MSPAVGLMNSSRKKAFAAYRATKPVMDPLLELFAVVDDVCQEPDLFEPAKYRATLGRIYRQWLKTRTALDPTFDSKRFRNMMKHKG